MKKVIFPEIKKDTIRYQDLTDKMVIGIRIYSEHTDKRFAVIRINEELHTMMIPYENNLNSIYIDPFNNGNEIEKNPYKSIHDLIDRIKEIEDERNVDFYVFEHMDGLFNWIALGDRMISEK